MYELMVVPNGRTDQSEIYQVDALNNQSYLYSLVFNTASRAPLTTSSNTTKYLPLKYIILHLFSNYFSCNSNIITYLPHKFACKVQPSNPPPPLQISHPLIFLSISLSMFGQ
uniref:Uncharacterized protein n=1 Tax=Lepeophtheirus salmonis TaxID=72036 RepID=A0A0K2V1Z4_LEPSM